MEKEARNYWGSLMKQAREYYGETQAQFGERFGYESATAISLIESGQRDMPGVIAYWLCAEFEILPKKLTRCDKCQGEGFIVEQGILPAGSE